MTFGFSDGSRNNRKPSSVSSEVFVPHGQDGIHLVARSCTTTAYRWLFCDSPSSKRTLWFVVIKSPNFSARGTSSPVRLLQGALVILARKHTSQFRSFGKWVKILCFRDATFVGRSESESWEMCADTSTSAISRYSVKFSSHSGIPSPLPFPATPLLQSSASPLLSVFAGSNETDRSCGGDDEEEVVVELDDSPGTTNGTKFSVLQKVWFQFLVRRGSVPLGHS